MLSFLGRFLQSRYKELLRVSRQWRDLKMRKWFGFGHDSEAEPGEGDLALQCLSCPRPGFNIFGDELKKIGPKATVGLMLDGNFSAEHLKPQRADDDVPINEGTGFMVSDSAYQKHLTEATQAYKDVRYRLLYLGSANAFTERQVYTCEVNLQCPQGR